MLLLILFLQEQFREVEGNDHPSRLRLGLLSPVGLDYSISPSYQRNSIEAGSEPKDRVSTEFTYLLALTPLYPFHLLFYFISFSISSPLYLRSLKHDPLIARARQIFTLSPLPLLGALILILVFHFLV